MNSFMMSSLITVTGNQSLYNAKQNLKNEDLMNKGLNLKPKSEYKV